MTEQERDRLHLDWLERWSRGETFIRIAADYGVTKGAVTGQVQRILRDYQKSEAV